jgi:CRISPR-associated protein Cas2
MLGSSSGDAMKQFTIIAFDVSNDRARAGVVKALLAKAVRVQKSVFEAAALEEASFLRLRSDIEGLIDLASDRVMYLRTCATCAGKIVFVGTRCQTPDSTDPVQVV